MNKRTKYQQQAGFTIMELLIATVVFAVILLILLTAFINISRLFYKGVNVASTQEDARTITQDIGDDIQFAQSQPLAPSGYAASPGSGFFCIGSHIYQYQLGTQYESGVAGNIGLQRASIDSPADCVSGTGSNPEELLGNGMQLNVLNVTCASSRCVVHLHIVFYDTGDTTVLDSPSANTLGYQAPDAECTGNIESSQYCASADYESTVLQSL